jgi:hypothetical protein
MNGWVSYSYQPQVIFLKCEICHLTIVQMFVKVKLYWSRQTGA